MMMRISDLRNKDVISNTDGKRLGFVSDIEINTERGNIDAIVIPGESKFFFLFGHSEELVIPWTRIKKIGIDVILVDSEQEGLKSVTPDTTVDNTTKISSSLSKNQLTARDDDDDFFTF